MDSLFNLKDQPMDLIIENFPLLLWTGTILYSFAFIYELLSLIFKKSYSIPLFYATLGAGFLLQGLALYYRGLQLSTFPLTNTLELLQVIAWNIVFLTIIFQIAFNLRLLGFFGSALASILGLVSLMFYNIHTPVSLTIQQNPWIEFHAILAIFAYGVFGLLAITSLMYLLQDYALSHKYFGGFFTLLPSLKQLSLISQRLLLIGLVSLGLAVGIGTLTWLTKSGYANFSKILSAWGLLIGYLILYTFKVKNRLNFRKSSWTSLALFMMAMLLLWPIQS